MKGVILAIALAASCWAQGTFTNPLLPSGADPWVTQKDGYYYYLNSTGINITIWKTRSIPDLAHATPTVVWTPPSSGAYSHEIWAPELHFLRGKWYLYFAGDERTNQTHRIFALENPSADPTQGTWTFKGKVADPAADRWAIDASVFENRGKLYMIWSGWEGDENGAQNIYIAPMSDPWTIAGPRVLLSRPEYPWEKVGDLQHVPGEPPHVDVNEGPEILAHGDDLFLIYSASGCWTDYYELGMLHAAANADLLNPRSWTKSRKPVFHEAADADTFATGHNGFFKSPDGKQDWIIYHANPGPNQGCGQRRQPRAQQFTWNADGSPNFGIAVPVGIAIPRPSGEALVP